MMPNRSYESRPHSTEYFGEDRDFFWNDDFLDLLARRLDLRSIRSAIDVGCGVGHWTEVILPRMAPEAKLVGIDRESNHIADFNLRFQTWEAGGQAAAIQADVANLPFSDGSFDLATCQTLLLHLAEPERALGEMIRVTRPGGLLLCVEPNNLVGRLPWSGLVQELSRERLLRLSEMVWRYVLGRAARGLGSELVGEMLPGLFDRLGLEHIRVWLSDKATPLIPPYDTAAQRAAISATTAWRNEGIGPFDREETRLNVIAGGGSEEFFETAWADFIELDRRKSQALSEKRWHSAGGTLFYIVAGRKQTR